VEVPPLDEQEDVVTQTPGAPLAIEHGPLSAAYVRGRNAYRAIVYRVIVESMVLGDESRTSQNQAS